MAPRKRIPPRLRSGGQVTVAELAARMAAVEERIARLESGRAPPGDGRAAVRKFGGGPRCPGCGLPRRVRAGRCAACGRPIDSL